MLDNDLADRFWNKVDRAGLDECWEWNAGKSSGGYGTFFVDGKSVSAHRLAWQFEFGEIPNGDRIGSSCICHSCDNPGCVNPAHLFHGTQKENMVDRELKGRGNRLSGECNPNSKLSDLDVMHIRELLNVGCMQSEIAKALGVSDCAIWNIKHGKSWKHA